MDIANKSPKTNFSSKETNHSHVDTFGRTRSLWHAQCPVVIWRMSPGPLWFCFATTLLKSLVRMWCQSRQSMSIWVRPWPDTFEFSNVQSPALGETSGKPEEMSLLLCIHLSHHVWPFSSLMLNMFPSSIQKSKFHPNQTYSSTFIWGVP